MIFCRHLLSDLSRFIFHSAQPEAGHEAKGGGEKPEEHPEPAKEAKEEINLLEANELLYSGRNPKYGGRIVSREGLLYVNNPEWQEVLKYETLLYARGKGEIPAAEQLERSRLRLAATHEEIQQGTRLAASRALEKNVKIELERDRRVMEESLLKIFLKRSKKARTYPAMIAALGEINLIASGVKIDFRDFKFEKGFPSNILQNILDSQPEKRKEIVREEILAHPAWRAYCQIFIHYARIWCQMERESEDILKAEEIKFTDKDGNDISLEDKLRQYVTDLDFVDKDLYFGVMRQLLVSYKKLKIEGKRKDKNGKEVPYIEDNLIEALEGEKDSEGIPADDDKRKKLEEKFEKIKQTIVSLRTARSDYLAAKAIVDDAKKYTGGEGAITADQSTGAQARKNIAELEPKMKAAKQKHGELLSELLNELKNDPQLKKFAKELAEGAGAMEEKDIKSVQDASQKAKEKDIDWKKLEEAFVLKNTPASGVARQAPPTSPPPADSPNSTENGQVAEETTILDTTLNLANDKLGKIKNWGTGASKGSPLQPGIMKMEQLIHELAKKYFKERDKKRYSITYGPLDLEDRTTTELQELIAENKNLQDTSQEKVQRMVQRESTPLWKHLRNVFTKRLKSLSRILGGRPNEESVSVSIFISQAFKQVGINVKRDKEGNPAFFNQETRKKLSNALFFKRVSTTHWRGLFDQYRAAPVLKIVECIERGELSRDQVYRLHFLFNRRDDAIDSFDPRKKLELTRLSENLLRAWYDTSITQAKYKTRYLERDLKHVAPSLQKHLSAQEEKIRELGQKEAGRYFELQRQMIDRTVRAKITRLWPKAAWETTKKGVQKLRTKIRSKKKDEEAVSDQPTPEHEISTEVKKESHSEQPPTETKKKAA